MKKLIAIIAGALLCAGVIAPATAASATGTNAKSVAVIKIVQAKKFKNCTKLNKKYKGGVAKKGVKYNKVGKKKRAFKVRPKISNALYKANKSLDRDGDGIACEK